MPNIIEANLIAEGKKFAVVVSRFNDFITERLVGGRRGCAGEVRRQG